ncbi:23S rRNA (uracil(1939)-C(5))-methyltransferase RlmD [Lachnospiraceae bacterium Marseille-Q4251]|nr:23S rRNA (uracil(1939)-C(5))-methyltransferase RlmD [Lachnospiraceae bacterium Marseille-Q4251]
MKKDDLIEVTIEDLSEEGTGIGKFEGMTFFIKDAVIGDRVRAKIMKLKKTYGFARLMEVLTPSPDRVEPLCPVARQCGGCQIQAMSYEAQLAFKTRKVENNLKRIGKFEEIPMESIIGMEDPFHYRNKAQFPFGKNRDGKIITGFYAGRTHSIIENTSCHLGKEVNEEILEKILAWMNAFHVEPYNEATGKGLMRHSLIRCGFRTGEIMVCLVINGRKIPGEEALVDSLKIIPGMTSISLNVNKEKTNVILGREVINLWGRPYIEDYIGEVKYQISPLSFFQVNPVQTERLYGKALEYAGLTGEETVWDLYCGIGTISLFLARKARKVYGVEIIPDAIEDARRNASLNGFTNTEFYVGKAEEVLPEKYEKEGVHADVIVVDPPRKGCDETLLSTMVKMQPERIVYVSCDSATLARDLRYLCDNGYELKRVCPADMFPQTVHVETVVLLSQQKPDDTIEIDLDLDELDATSAETKATYQEIKDYVLKEFGLKVSNLYISQIKRKCGIEVGENYNLPKTENPKVPQCPKEKEDAIKAALKYFAMI